MFKDTDEALARLEAELLREEEEPEVLPEEYEEEYDDEFEDAFEEEEGLPPEYAYEDTRPADGPVIYQNFSNNYGKNLRNYASGYRAYNSDISDEDLDSYSEDVLQTEPEKSNTPLILIACLLSLGIVAVLLIWLFLFRGGF